MDLRKIRVAFEDYAYGLEYPEMIRFQFDWSLVVANFLIVGSLAFSGFVGAVNAFAEDTEIISPATRANVADKAATGGSKVNGKVRSAKGTRAGSSQVLGVRLSKDGMLTGRLNLTDSISGAHVPAEKLSIRFVQRGSILAEAKPGPGGVFQVDKMSPGVVTMIATGVDGFFSTSLVIHPFEEYADGESKPAMNPLQIDATVVHPSNVAVVSKLIQGGQENRTSKNSRPQASNAGSRIENVSSRVEPIEEEPSASPVPLQTPVLAIGPDGQVHVNLYNIDPATGARSPAAGVVVYLIQRGVIRSRNVVDQDGLFNARGMIPGQYSFLALSENGGNRSFAAMGVLLEDAKANANMAKASTRLSVIPARAASRQDNGPPPINMAPVNDLNQTQNQGQTPPEAPPAAGGGMTGGGGGGGFGGGAGGALGAIGLGAGIAGLATALANQNKNNGTAASPATP